MKDFADTLLNARQSLISDFATQAASARQQLAQLDALLSANGVDVASLPSLGQAADGAVTAAPKRRGRRPGSGRKGKVGRPRKVQVEAESAAAPAKATKKRAAKKAARKAAKKAGRKKSKSGVNVTAAVREVITDIAEPFTVKDLRNAFEKKYPGVLASRNRIALSLAMQSLSRQGEVTAKKAPTGKGNLFSRAKK
ncbi:MAG: hypothetical protein KDK99_17970 [Verrucomicrobiales bacterium]|nr:hypothetical protein [Verrucomicrobiales bacterium]